MLKETPLASLHRASGARMMPFAGYDMPVQYRGVLAECDAVRNRAGIFDVSHMGHCHASDPALSRLLSRPLEKIAVGKSSYMLIMNPGGGIIDDCIGYRMEDNLWHIILNASRKEIDIETLKNVTPVTDQAMIALQGPRALAMVGDLCARRSFARNVKVLDVDITLVARTGYTGEDGYEFILHESKAALLWTRLIEAGAQACGLGARDVLRIEAALPLYGSDISEETDPFETGLGFAVDLDREHFIAKESLTKKKAHPTRRRAGLIFEKGAVPRHDYPVMDAGGREIGKVTSGTFSPMLQTGIALCLIEKDAVPASIIIRGANCIAKEVPLPFYRREK